MSNKDEEKNLSDKENKTKSAKVNIPDNLSKDKLEAIQNTYDLYASTKFEYKTNENTKQVESTVDKKHQKKSAPVTLPKPAITPLANLPKVKIPEPVLLPDQVKSINNLKPELQQNLKSAVTAEVKAEVNKILEEMDSQKSQFLTSGDSILGKTTKAEKANLTKRLAELEVPREITEINVTAIVSCMNKTINNYE